MASFLLSSEDRFNQWIYVGNLRSFSKRDLFFPMCSWEKTFLRSNVASWTKFIVESVSFLCRHNTCQESASQQKLLANVHQGTGFFWEFVPDWPREWPFIGLCMAMNSSTPFGTNSNSFPVWIAVPEFGGTLWIRNHGNSHPKLYFITKCMNPLTRSCFRHREDFN